MAGKVMFLRSNQGGRLDGNESVADSFRSDLVGFKSWSGRIIGAFTPSYVCQKNPPVGKRTRYPRSPLSHSSDPLRQIIFFPVRREKEKGATMVQHDVTGTGAFFPFTLM
ncbi:hypothetical protein TNCV_3889461 [Trichonephila clavipes]|nr:hypothetical protein TNCV_3889461 [Trichonephila clavipes]